MKIVYAKRTEGPAGDCWIVVQDADTGEKRHARMVAIRGSSELYADPIDVPGYGEFREAGVYIVCSEATIMVAADEAGRVIE